MASAGGARGTAGPRLLMMRAMITRVEGVLESVEGNEAVVRLAGGVCLEVMLSAHAAGRLATQVGAVGEAVTLHTIAYLDSPNQGGTFFPRLAGFPSAEDRAFFELLTSVKGIGYRKAMRAMALPVASIAAAIAQRDTATLQSLPEVGKRTAEAIIAELHDKVDRFLGAAPATAEGVGSASGGAGRSAGSPGGAAGIVREALEVLVQLGENRLLAMQWIDQAMAQADAPVDSGALIQRVYRIKSAR